MKTITRRRILSYSLGGSAALGVMGTLAIRSGSGSPNERVNVAVIGINGMGHFHVRTLANRTDAHIVALCDVDPAVLQKVSETVKNATGKTPKLESDFRQVLADPSIEAVVIATPHHWHAPMALRAMKAGKGRLCRKGRQPRLSRGSAAGRGGTQIQSNLSARNPDAGQPAAGPGR